MRNAVIITAKGGNKSIDNKNVLEVLGLPVVSYVIRSAQESALSDMVFVSTEDKTIRDTATKEGAHIIDRPMELATPESLHADTIAHAVREVEKDFPEVQRVAVLLGNTVMVSADLIDDGFRIVSETEADSCMSVWKAQDDHPYRALRLSDEGYAESFLSMSSDSNRQSYPPVYFYDQGVWVFEKDCAYRREGPLPWVWLGKRCRMIERPWVTGRDIHSWIDVSASIWYLNELKSRERQGTGRLSESV